MPGLRLPGPPNDQDGTLGSRPTRTRARERTSVRESASLPRAAHTAGAYTVLGRDALRRRVPASGRARSSLSLVARRVPTNPPPGGSLATASRRRSRRGSPRRRPRLGTATTPATTCATAAYGHGPCGRRLHLRVSAAPLQVRRPRHRRPPPPLQRIRLIRRRPRMPQRAQHEPHGRRRTRHQGDLEKGHGRPLLPNSAIAARARPS
jgi:hypothetical protein